MNLKEYKAIIFEWEKKYGVPSQAFRYDPTLVRTCCKKCDQMKPKMARHHKANDFFFALWFPDWYAARYIQFHSEDCDKLCKDCHTKCHKYFYSLAQEMYSDFDYMKENHTPAQVEFWKNWCEGWKGKFLALYTKWINQPLRKRKKRRLRNKREA